MITCELKELNDEGVTSIRILHAFAVIFNQSFLIGNQKKTLLNSEGELGHLDLVSEISLK